MKAKSLIKIFIFLLVIFGVSAPSFAGIKSKAFPGDSRFRYWTYQPNTFFEYTGYMRVAARIDLDPNEKVISITLGVPDGWQLNPTGHRLYIKPTQLDIDTHMTIITDKRIYYFEIKAAESFDFKDKDIPFSTTFLYADQDGAGNTDIMDFSAQQETASYVPDPVKDAPMLNFNYTKSGAESITPIEIFDDNEFTYIKFRDLNAAYPAIFEVLPDGNEAIVNFRISPNGYVVLEMVGSQYTLRYGNETACIFNEKKPLKRVEDKNKNTTFFGIF